MEYPKRKHPRLKNYDYSLPGYYYVTIHAEKERPVFSSVQQTEYGIKIKLTSLGQILEVQLLALEQRFSTVKVDKYVIMPNHIHAILALTAPGGPDLTALIGRFKSLSTKKCNALLGILGERLFQQSFYETVLRNETAYQEAWRCIEENPAKWIYVRDGQRRG